MEKYTNPDAVALNSSSAQYVSGRLARIAGHTKHVKSLVTRGHDCSQVLIQLSAVIGNLTSVSNVILSEYLDSCIELYEKTGDKIYLDKFKKAMKSAKK